MSESLSEFPIWRLKIGQSEPTTAHEEVHMGNRFVPDDKEKTGIGVALKRIFG